VEHLDVAPDALDADVEGVNRLEHRRQQQQREQRRHRGRSQRGRRNRHRGPRGNARDEDADARSAALADRRPQGAVFVLFTARHSFWRVDRY